MKKRTRFMSGVMALLTTASLLGGCGAKQTTMTADVAEERGMTGGSVTEADTGEQKTLRVAVFDRASPGLAADDNFTTQYVKDNFGKKFNVNVEFVPIPRSQEVDKLNMLMAANDAPDICFTYYSEGASCKISVADFP